MKGIAQEHICATHRRGPRRRLRLADSRAPDKHDRIWDFSSDGRSFTSKIPRLSPEISIA